MRFLSVFLAAGGPGAVLSRRGNDHPIYQLVKSADLLNTYAALIIAYITLTCRSRSGCCAASCSACRKALEEAAALDGARPLQAFFQIVVPLARPGIIATTVFVLIVTWQEFCSRCPSRPPRRCGRCRSA
jgi:ABC-type glycerol-3-phosphate transport system permease component